MESRGTPADSQAKTKGIVQLDPACTDNPQNCGLHSGRFKSLSYGVVCYVPGLTDRVILLDLAQPHFSHWPQLSLATRLDMQPSVCSFPIGI